MGFEPQTSCMAICGQAGALHCQMVPVGELTCTDNRLAWPVRAWLPRLLAPILAPQRATADELRERPPRARPGRFPNGRSTRRRQAAGRNCTRRSSRSTRRWTSCRRSRDLQLLVPEVRDQLRRPAQRGRSAGRNPRASSSIADTAAENASGAPPVSSARSRFGDSRHRDTPLTAPSPFAAPPSNPHATDRLRKAGGHQTETPGNRRLSSDSSAFCDLATDVASLPAGSVILPELVAGSSWPSLGRYGAPGQLDRSGAHCGAFPVSQGQAPCGLRRRGCS